MPVSKAQLIIQYSNFLNAGAFHQLISTTSIVITPPKSTAGTVPKTRAVKPLSNWPSSLEELMNMELTELTRPRMSSGVVSCRMVPRTTTLMPSSMPAITSAANDIQNKSDRPKAIMQTPKPATANSKIRPWCCRSGNKVMVTIIAIEPISIAALSQPKPTGPTLKMRSANSGISATAPPNSTAKRSSEMAPSNILCANT